MSDHVDEPQFFKDLRRMVESLIERVGKLETHHVRQIDENRAVSRALDEFNLTDHDERIHDLENIQAEKRLCNLEETIIGNELKFGKAIKGRSYEEPLADALAFIIGHPNSIPKETINFINCLTTFLMRNEKATTGEILENLRGTPFEAIACKLAIRETNLSP